MDPAPLARWIMDRPVNALPPDSSFARGHRPGPGLIPLPTSNRAPVRVQSEAHHLRSRLLDRGAQQRAFHRVCHPPGYRLRIRTQGPLVPARSPFDCLRPRPDSIALANSAAQAPIFALSGTSDTTSAFHRAATRLTANPPFPGSPCPRICSASFAGRLLACPHLDSSRHYRSILEAILTSFSTPLQTLLQPLCKPASNPLPNPSKSYQTSTIPADSVKNRLKPSFRAALQRNPLRRSLVQPPAA